MNGFNLSDYIEKDEEYLSRLRKTCIGFGKIEFTAISKNAVSIPKRHFLICKNEKTIDFIDLELGLVWWSTVEDFKVSIHEGILNLAKMIILNAEDNVKKFGEEKFQSLYEELNNSLGLEFYREMKKKVDTNNTKKNVASSNLPLNSDFKSEIKYSCEIAA